VTNFMLSVAATYLPFTINFGNDLKRFLLIFTFHSILANFVVKDWTDSIRSAGPLTRHADKPF